MPVRWSEHQEVANINRAGLTTTAMRNPLLQPILAGECRVVRHTLWWWWWLQGKRRKIRRGRGGKTTTLPFRDQFSLCQHPGSSAGLDMPLCFHIFLNTVVFIHKSLRITSNTLCERPRSLKLFRRRDFHASLSNYRHLILKKPQ